MGLDNNNNNGRSNIYSSLYQRQRCCHFNIPSLIMKKRDGGKLTKQEITYFIEQVVDREVQDGQLGAMLMAMFIRNLDNEETTYMTRAMTTCGDQLTWPEEWKGKVLDKHSTGGVGDKVSLVLAPALAALGYKVPMVSGRGLGHTGGTLDKLESIPGFTVSLSHAEMLTVLENVGCCIVGQTSNLVPADKILYATRDVTGTTENIGLITSSIISKKAAENLDALVLDVKVGRGSFMKKEKDAMELAKRMVKAGKGSGIKTVAVLSEMDTPIGRMIGNALEVVESIQTMHGKGPSDLVELVVELGGNLLQAAGKIDDAQEGANLVKATLEDGTALEKFKEMMIAQGVNTDTAEALCMNNAQLFDILPKSKYIQELQCKTAGYVCDIEALSCAQVTAKMGAGRTKAGDSVNFAVGIELKVALGDAVEEGSTWIKIHHDSEECPEEFIKMLEDSITISSEKPRKLLAGHRILNIIR